MDGRKMNGKSSSSGSVNLGGNTLGSFLGIASLGAGAYHGYMDAQGTPLPKENLEWMLTYGPAVVQGGIYAILGGITGLIGGGVAGASSGSTFDSTFSLAKGAAGATLGTAAGAGLGGAKGGLETLVGYGIGYVVGSLAK